MTIEEEVLFIQSALSEEERLCQLAEEAAELSQAALKYRRTLTEENPTPVTRSKAEKALLEELGDVLGAAEVCYLYNTDWPAGPDFCNAEIDRCKNAKLRRWAKRLRARGN